MLGISPGSSGQPYASAMFAWTIGDGGLLALTKHIIA